MSICPKNKSSKARRDKRSKLENVCSEPCKMQQMWCSYDAAQSLQSLWFLQQKRSRCNGLIFINRNQFRCAMQQKAPVTGGFFVVSAGCLEASYKRFDVVCRDVL